MVVRLLPPRLTAHLGFGGRAYLAHKVYREVQLPQGLTPLQVLDLGDVVHGKIEVLQILAHAAPSRHVGYYTETENKGGVALSLT